MHLHIQHRRQPTQLVRRRLVSCCPLAATLQKSPPPPPFLPEVNGSFVTLTEHPSTGMRPARLPAPPLPPYFQLTGRAVTPLSSPARHEVQILLGLMESSDEWLNEEVD